MSGTTPRKPQKLRMESLESREMMAGDFGAFSMPYLYQPPAYYANPQPGFAGFAFRPDQILKGASQMTAGVANAVLGSSNVVWSGGYDWNTGWKNVINGGLSIGTGLNNMVNAFSQNVHYRDVPAIGELVANTSYVQNLANYFGVPSDWVKFAGQSYDYYGSATSFGSAYTRAGNLAQIPNFVYDTLNYAKSAYDVEQSMWSMINKSSMKSYDSYYSNVGSYGYNENAKVTKPVTVKPKTAQVPRSTLTVIPVKRSKPNSNPIADAFAAKPTGPYSVPPLIPRW